MREEGTHPQALGQSYGLSPVITISANNLKAIMRAAGEDPGGIRIRPLTVPASSIMWKKLVIVPTLKEARLLAGRIAYEATRDPFRAPDFHPSLLF